MNIELHEIKISEVFDGYTDKGEDGVVAYGGRLDVRPAFQREFIYKDKQRDDVIRSVRKGFPLNSMYWIKADDGNFEMMDGQQRTLSICQYLSGGFSVDKRNFFNLLADEKKQILDYKLMVYVCDGTEQEKIDWFKIVNIAGVELTPQEILNSVLRGSWVYDAKKYFSKQNCAAYTMAKEYMAGAANRQEYLETAISWIAERDGVEFNISNCPRVGFGELNVVSGADDNLDTLADFLQIAVHYVKNFFNKKTTSYNIFFYHRDEKIFAKVMSRYATSPYFVGYNIHFLPNNTERIAKEIREYYFDSD